MGYYTHHTLHVRSETADLGFVECLGLDRGCTWDDAKPIAVGIQSFDQEEQSKWYDSDREMVAVSLLHPETLFILDGDGEEQGDVWRAFYLNGQTYRWELGEIVRPEFDPGLLREPGEEG